MTPKEFEQFLDSLAEAPSVDDDPYLAEVREARDRLRRHPELLRGGEDHFVYDDPVLTKILVGAQEAQRLEQNVLAASASPGGNLTNSWYRWAPTICRTVYHRLTGSEEQLASRTPIKEAKIDKPKVRLGIVGDAGYSGRPQDVVLDLILARHKAAPFDAVIHLGDVYFAAGPEEMKKHFLAPFSALGFQGSRVYTLLGNHDVYLGGAAYLAALKTLDQPGRYFCIETDNWIVACVDTTLFDSSYNKGSGGMEPTQLDWLQGLLQREKPLILLSHHYYASAWGESGQSLRSVLHPVFQRSKAPCAWYWGHEHLVAAYDKHPDGFTGACLGNGAFLEEAKEPRRFAAGAPLPPWYLKPAWYAASRCTCFDKKARYWPHGFLEVELTPGRIEESYHLENEASPSFHRMVPV
ncbi:MAG: metallophosphoesterase [Bryobacteraceae bacterium]|jgi:hypothetical protein